MNHQIYNFSAEFWKLDIFALVGNVDIKQYVVFERQVVENNATLWWGFKIEYFKVCISEFHFGDSILKESETNITDNWTGVREQCFNQKIDGLLLQKRNRIQYELIILLLFQTQNARCISIKIYGWGFFT